MKSLKFSLSIILLLTLAFTISSCNRGPVFEHYLKMKNTVWDRFDIKQIEIPVEKAPVNYDITVVVHCTERFQYADLPFYVILTTPSGEERMREVTVPVRENGKLILDPETGKAKVQLVLWKGLNMGDNGICKITFENMIPKIQTEGVDEIGIVVEKSK